MAILATGCHSPASPPVVPTEKKGTDAAAPATDLSQEEKKLIHLRSEVLRVEMEQRDSTAFYSSKFNDSFYKLVDNSPATLLYPFKQLRDSSEVYVETGAGNTFRIYSWNTHTGGSMSYFDGIYQWEGRDSIHARRVMNKETDPGFFCSKIYTVTAGGKEYHLAILNGVYSSKDVSQSVAAFTIDGDQLVDTVKIFAAGSRRLNRIDVNFDFFSVVDRPERPLELITYDEKNKLLYIPVVNEKGAVTAKNLVYELKEDGFVYTGVETGKRN